MATYKVIQDVEAEDKFLGPLTLKQFIFGAIGVLFGYLSFFAVSEGATFLLALFFPPMALGFFLAIPWSSEQPTEVWVLAKLRFKFKNQPRIWDQSGLEELVTINVPKKIEKHLTNGLDQTEVQSRLKALAETIDTRGWAVKNATLNQGDSGGRYPQAGDRLINPAALPRSVPEIDMSGYEDVLSEDTAVSENFNQMIQTNATMHKQQSLDKMERVRHGEPIEPVQQPVINFTPPANAYTPEGNAPPSLDDQLLSAELRNKQAAGDIGQSRMRGIAARPAAASSGTFVAAGQPPQDDQVPSQTASAQAAVSVVKQPQAEMTKPVNPAILELAQNNDLNISTIARQSHRNDQTDNEVVISLR